jgi:hypothetical protein
MCRWREMTKSGSVRPRRRGGRACFERRKQRQSWGRVSCLDLNLSDRQRASMYLALNLLKLADMVGRLKPGRSTFLRDGLSTTCSLSAPGMICCRSLASVVSTGSSRNIKAVRTDSSSDPAWSWETRSSLHRHQLSRVSSCPSIVGRHFVACPFCGTWALEKGRAMMGCSARQE